MRAKSKRYELTYVSRPRCQGESNADVAMTMAVVAPNAVAARRFVLESEWANGRLVSTFLDVKARGA